jgi:hypothetical protein
MSQKPFPPPYDILTELLVAARLGLPLDYPNCAEEAPQSARPRQVGKVHQHAFGTRLPTRRQGAAWTTRHAPFRAHRGQCSKLMAESSPTIEAVTQTPHPVCPRSSGTLSAISLEWVSAISGMRTNPTDREKKGEQATSAGGRP